MRDHDPNEAKIRVVKDLLNWAGSELERSEYFKIKMFVFLYLREINAHPSEIPDLEFGPHWIGVNK